MAPRCAAVNVPADARNCSSVWIAPLVVEDLFCFLRFLGTAFLIFLRFGVIDRALVAVGILASVNRTPCDELAKELVKRSTSSVGYFFESELRVR
jgi:hypothetical protein